jgi:quercetin dioxygenase-like cupin family protein
MVDSANQRKKIMTTRPHLDTERPLHAQVQVFALDQIATATWAETAGVVGHNAITLRKAAGLTLVLLTMHAGSQLQEHDAAAPIAFHVISGRIRFTTDDKAVELGPQMVLTLDGGIKHRVDALEDAVCLLILGGAADDTHPGR